MSRFADGWVTLSISRFADGWEGSAYRDLPMGG
jgi:hypothetical protein